MDNLDTTQTTDNNINPINVDNTKTSNDKPVDNPSTTTEPSKNDNTTITPNTGEEDGKKPSEDSKDTVSTTPIEIPNFIEVYSYNPNGYYLGTDIADKDPLDKNNYLLPANTTKEKPPEITLGKIQKWNGTIWEIVDMPKSVVMSNETNKNNNEEINDLHEKITDLEDKINKLEKLITGVIVSKLNVNTNLTTK